MLKFYSCMLGVAVLTTALPVAAQIYKWTDAQGKIHYSDYAGDASAGRSTQIRVTPAQPAGDAPPAQDWRVREAEFQKRQRMAATPEPRFPTVSARSGSASDLSYRSEKPGAKCGLARDILSGAAQHTNRKPTDQNDRDIATNDIKTFCR
ncbi:DUF4124 domain-containing protein [Massilia sp. S19_KUP03_FR1]|uniref:DUF4124 domain-containing protein n=1 Tax=Massilia sp. S19_KUP03_FR1 TaxID=3025503 RepID=UPI002FCDC11E